MSDLGGGKNIQTSNILISRIFSLKTFLVFKYFLLHVFNLQIFVSVAHVLHFAAVFTIYHPQGITTITINGNLQGITMITKMEWHLI